MKLDPGVPLSFLVQHVKEATKGPDGKTVPIYVDPIGLEEASNKTGSNVRLNIEGVPLRTTLRLALKQLDLMYEIDEGMLIITRDDPEEPRQKVHREPSVADKARDEAILAKLEAAVPMRFPDQTPLDDVLDYLKLATKGPGDQVIPIYVDPDGIQDAGNVKDSTIAIDLEDVPLRTTLRLLLGQIGLRYEVRGGMILIDAQRPEPAAPQAGQGPGNAGRMGGMGGMM